MIPTQRKNKPVSKSLPLNEIARLVDGEIVGDGQVTITGVATIREAEEGEITFLSNPKYLPYLEDTRASAIITSKDVSFTKKPIVRTANPSLAFSKIISIFTPPKPPREDGVHPTAVIHKSVQLGKDVSIGPHVVIEKESIVGDRSVIEAGTFIGANCVVGAEVWIYPNVTIREDSLIGNHVIIHSGCVIGSDGFGYETVEGRHVKIPQMGSVCIEDHVEIGANVCIDRGRFQKTWIQEGTKIDNLVQIAHNVVIGPHGLIVSQAGISGSTELGKSVVVAGQAGIVGHLKLGDNVVVGARSGVTKNVPDNTIVLGGPAKPIAEQKKIYALIARLPKLFEEMSELKRKISGK